MATSPYCGARIALATRHGKQRVLAPALRHGLGAELLHLPGIDTDALGSFCGCQPRRGSARDAALAKAEAALRLGGSGLAIASEGSFGPHPAIPLLPVGIECLLFRDASRNLTVVVERIARRTNYAQLNLTRAQVVAPRSDQPLSAWLAQVGFPSHGLLVRSFAPGSAGEVLLKGVQGWPQLQQAIAQAARGCTQGRVRLETDMRAHCNPTRMASIRRLGFELVRRLASACPACACPGWGRIAGVQGLPCSWCGQPTPLARAELFGCAGCGHRSEQPRRDGLLQADPGQCAFCNP